ncbi:MAG: hypothetical protein K0Q91_1017 [Fibrobacteria bacterium]|jgi:hypothetical protein|nr:hypothetical protein [Fibrobacteria bacterium]
MQVVTIVVREVVSAKAGSILRGNLKVGALRAARKKAGDHRHAPTGLPQAVRASRAYFHPYAGFPDLDFNPQRAPMRRLLYTAAHGHPIYLEMAQECVRSARRQGFEGDCLVLSDREVPLEGAECRAVEAGPGLLAKAGLARALSRAEIEAYDQVLFLDADCVFRGPVERVFGETGLRVAVQLPGKKHALGNYNLLFMTRDERRRFHREHLPLVNTGMVLMPGERAHGFLTAWETFWRACPRHEKTREYLWRLCNPELMDQPALQAWLLREAPAWEPFPMGLMGFPMYGPSLDSTVLHFCGQAGEGKSREESKEVVLAWMRAVVDGRPFEAMRSTA